MLNTTWVIVFAIDKTVNHHPSSQTRVFVFAQLQKHILCTSSIATHIMGEDISIRNYFLHSSLIAKRYSSIPACSIITKMGLDHLENRTN